MQLDIRISDALTKALALAPGGYAVSSTNSAEISTIQTKIVGIKSIITNAVDILSAANAWPSQAFAPYFIELDLGSDIQTKWGALDAKGILKNRSISINPDAPLRISIGLDLLSSPPVVAITKQTRAQPFEVLVLLMVHETFHLMEADNMSLCGVPYGQHKSGFARALHPAFSEPWRLAMLALADEFPAPREPDNPLSRMNTLAIWKAGDIASEACADMFALQLIASVKTSVVQNDWIKAVCEMRQRQEAAGAATVVDCNNQASNPEYQIGSVLARFATQLVKEDKETIREVMWREAFNAALLESAYLTSQTREKINAALIKPAKEPHSQKPASLWQTLSSKFRT